MNFLKWSLAVGICLAVFGGLAAYKVAEIRAGIAAGEAYPEPAETVEAAAVGATPYASTLSVIGELVAPRRLDLRNELAGEIVAVNFVSGARVAAGQVLLQLDIAVEEANLQAARARAELAQLQFERQQELLEKRVTTQELLDQARAALTATEAEIAVLERNIEKKTLRSPFAGTAGLHNFEVGQYLEANTLITSLIGDSEEMWVDFQVPQFYPRLGSGDKLVVDIVGDDGSAPVTATVIAENTILEATNRSRGYRASVPSEGGRHAPHTMVELQVPVGDSETLLLVPAQALQNDPLGQYVFVLEPDAQEQAAWRAQRRQVRVRAITEQGALLEAGSGLQPGVRIAAAGAFKLYEGIKVYIGERSMAAGETP
jgi:membrane fusion protein (multidrug efflux system)